MAVELCTDSPTLGTSPRISFSHDLSQSDIVPIEPHIPLKSSLTDYDFDFCVSRKSSDQDSSLADELFANGIILPIQINRKPIPAMKSKSLSSSSSSSALFPPLPPPSSVSNTEETDTSKEAEEKQGNNSKSFWKFKRSKSLNCGSIYKRGLCPLPLLSRSKSTGSTASAKRSLIPKDESAQHNNNDVKQTTQKNSNSSYHKKPPLKKNYGSSLNSGVVQVSPVLNVPAGKLLGLAEVV
ncbi:hypothetical protein Cgig2_029883 [Carnegiea gigantea]|uniref:Uncharacterized protein n=1 Tax=Carnegiea gigantea TaxID=171969 RepID=A0A9Q1K5A0_9CARY|nr:hypothetical protein Cgig2_029883 [Carnegiea gigantea]